MAAVQEERFTRKKHDAGFPAHAIEYCLESAGLTLADVDYLVFYDKPLIKFERLLETYLSYAPKGFRSFLSAMPLWLKEKLLIKQTLQKELANLYPEAKSHLPGLLFTDHHQSHAGSCFFPSPFEEAAVLCIDGVGEWATTSVWLAKGNRLTPCWEIHFPHSLGLLYSAFTYYTGFKVNSGEYKLMGLAPYGNPVYVDLIYRHLIHTKSDGSFRLDMSYFNYAAGLAMTSKKFDALFQGPPRQPESPLTQKQMDMARSIQEVIQERVVAIARNIKKELNVDNLCLAGGVALNCVANGKLMQEKIFKRIWIQPAAGDAGGALGAAYCAWHEHLDKPRVIPDTIKGKTDACRGAFLGPSYSVSCIRECLDKYEAVYEPLEDSALLPRVADLIASGHVVGWFQGRMEFGPRALGNRSILGDPRNPDLQSVMNLKIKYRESFRPFAPSVKFEAVTDWFDMEKNHTQSPYMLVTAMVQKDKQLPMNWEKRELTGLAKLQIPRSMIPAVTHVDYSARVQTVHRETNPRYWNLLDCFEKITHCPVLINTSFNVRGEPIVCTPDDAYQCFMRTGMDYLVMENFLLAKSDQKHMDADRQREFELD